MIKFFTFATSPYARKVRIAMDYKNVPYEPMERCYSLDRKEDLRSASARAEVPAIVLENGQTIADSTIICEYLEETFPQPPLMPKDPAQRARMRTLEDLCDRGFDATSFGYWLAVVRASEPEADSIRSAARKEIAQLLSRLEDGLGERKFFCGDLSVADIAAVCYVPAAPAMELKLTDYPKLSAWLGRMREIPAVAADLGRVSEAMKHMRDLKSEFEGPDGRVHWRDSRLEWPIRHGFLDFVGREYKANKMMFPPDGS